MSIYLVCNLFLDPLLGTVVDNERRKRFAKQLAALSFRSLSLTCTPSMYAPTPLELPKLMPFLVLRVT